MWTPAVPTIISGTMKRHNPDACQHWKGFSRYLRSQLIALKPSRVRENGRDLARSVGETRFFPTDGISPTSSASIIVTEKSRSSFSIASRVIVLARQRCVRRRELSGLSSVDIHVDDHVRGAKSPMIIRRAIEREMLLSCFLCRSTWRRLRLSGRAGGAFRGEERPTQIYSGKKLVGCAR